MRKQVLRSLRDTFQRELDKGGRFLPAAGPRGAAGSDLYVWRYSPVPMKTMFGEMYKRALSRLIGRALRRSDGFTAAQVAACEHRLALKLPAALRTYYRMAGRLPINSEHNRLYSPRQLKMGEGKIVFMEENQRVAFWGIDPASGAPDPPVFQAPNSSPLTWYPEEYRFSRFILTMLRWQRGEPVRHGSR